MLSFESDSMRGRASGEIFGQGPTMDESTYDLCLSHLEQAERCMIEGTDGFHLARLSLVIEMLKEAYVQYFSPAKSVVPGSR